MFSVWIRGDESNKAHFKASTLKHATVEDYSVLGYVETSCGMEVLVNKVYRTTASIPNTCSFCEKNRAEFKEMIGVT